MLNGLGKFELARRLLNHTAVVSLTAPYLVREFRADDNVLTVDQLVAYVGDLHAALASETTEGFPDPVLPVVDVAHLTVSHTTCTGHTMISVDARGVFEWVRHSAASPDDAVRDRLLHNLTDHGYGIEDKAWHTVLNASAWPMVGLDPLEPSVRLVSRHPGVYTLYRSPNGEDRLYTPDAVYSDFFPTPEDDEWMREAPATLRALVLADLVRG